MDVAGLGPAFIAPSLVAPLEGAVESQPHWPCVGSGSHT